jgi:hypothetical protein
MELMSEKLLCALTVPAKRPIAIIRKRDFIRKDWVRFSSEKISEKSTRKQLHLNYDFFVSLKGAKKNAQLEFQIGHS